MQRQRVSAFARELRQNQTDAEQHLWRALRGGRLSGVKFRRQYPCGAYVLDFYCPSKKLAIELDGGQHANAAAREHDARRADYLAERGITVLRFWNNDALLHTEAAGHLAGVEH